MLVRITQNELGSWDVTALSGDLYGELIARADGVRLSKARLHEHSITGFVSALHGAEIQPNLENHKGSDIPLGNQLFHQCHHEALFDTYNSGWYDRDTAATVRNCRFLNAIGDRVFYSQQEDVDEDRRTYLDAQAKPNETDPDSVTAVQGQGLLRTLMRKVKGE